MINIRSNMGYCDINYPNLDQTTPWFEFLSYIECCKSLGPIPGQPSIQRFMSYRRYLKSVGVIK